MRTKIITLICIVFAHYLGLAQDITHQHNSSYSFVENKGQWKENVLFKSNFDGGNLWVEQHRMLFHLQDFSEMQEAHLAVSEKSNKTPEIKQSLVYLNFVNSKNIESIEKYGPSTNYYNYFIGNDKSNWASEVRSYEEAILHDLYDGVDLKIIEKLEQLKYEFHVQPNIDPNQIILEYFGQRKVEISRKGDLVIKTSLGEIIEQKPYAYQIVNGSIREVECDFLLVDNQVTFKLGVYNPNVVLVIDPVLVFATYSGSTTDNFGMTATYGNDGTAYSGGTVFGNSYPTPAVAWNTTTNMTNEMPSANDPAGTYGVTDVFISKYSADGTNMLWTCFLGGGNDTIGTETVHSLVCDNEDNLYLFGATSSLDFPIQNGYQATHSGGESGANFYANAVYYLDHGTDIYVSKLSANGLNLLGSTYLGGSKNDGVNYNHQVSAYDSLVSNYGDQFRGEIILDSNGDCIVSSCSWSTDFPTLNGFQMSSGGEQDGVVFKLSSDLSSLNWSSYFGGNDKDACYSVKVDGSDNVIVAGGTASSGLTGMTGWTSTFNGGVVDGFVIKVAPSGNSLITGSYIGTNNYDQAYFVEVDRDNNVFLVGQSENGQFPVINSLYSNIGSSQFIIQLDSNLVNVIHSTVFGNGESNINISPSAFLVDICGSIYVSGWGANILQGTGLYDMPLSADPIQGTTDGFNFYLFVLEGDFTDLLYATYFGEPGIGEHVDGGTSRFDKNGVVYQSVCGACGGSNIGGVVTTDDAWSQTDLSKNCNNLVFKIDFGLIPNAEFTIDNNIGCLPFTVNFDNFSTEGDSYIWDFGNGDTSSVDFKPTIVYDSVGVFQVNLYVTDSICLLTDTAEVFITVFDSLQLSTDADISICTPVPIDLIAYSNGSSNQFIWSSSINFLDTLNTDISDSIFTVTPPEEVTYYIQVSNAGCSRVDSISIEVTSSLLLLSAVDSLCLGETTTISALSQNPAITFSNYVWTPDSIQVSSSLTNSIEVNPTTSQYVFVTAISNTGCLAIDSILINIGNIDTSLVSASASEYVVPEGGEVTLFGEPSGYSYLWTPSSLVDQPNNQQTTSTVEQTTLYTLFVTDGVCTKSDTVLIKTYEFLCDDPFLYVPNAFTPNGDGENDVLYVRGPAIQDMVFRIYDRLGEMVFESFERPYGWDGTFRGKLMNPDVYDYYLKVTCIDQVETIIKGNFQIIR